MDIDDLIHMNTNIRSLRSYLLLLLFQGLVAGSFGQRINYSEAEREDNRRTNFEIVGKVGGNFLVFKNNRNENDISVYDNSMKLIDRVPQNTADERWINVDFVSYPDYAWMIYQFQRRNIIYCNAVKVDGRGKRISEPVMLDTTRVAWAANNKIYTTLYSEDRKSVMLLKINNRNSSNFVFTTLLFDSQLQLRYKHQIGLPMEDRNEYFTDFLLDNEGNLYFGKFLKRSGSDYVSDVTLISKESMVEAFQLVPLKSNEMLDEVKLKIDNNNRRVLLNAFYYMQRRGNIEGLHFWVWDKASQSIVLEKEMPFTEEMRTKARNRDANARTAFNDYLINTVITRKDGGFLLVTEASYTTSRGGTYDRWGNRYWNWNNPWMSPMDYYFYSPYYNPYSSFYWDRWNYGRNPMGNRYHAENIYLFSFDAAGGLEWSNVINKAQYDDESDATISHMVFISGSELQVLFNLLERRNLMLNNQGVTPDGTINRYPTLKNLDHDIVFLPRFGRQVSAKSVVIPCLWRNSLIFAKIDF